MKKNSAQPQKSAPKRLLKRKLPVRKLLAGLLLATMLVTLIPSSLLLAGAEEIVQSSPAVTGAPAPTTSPTQPAPTPTNQPATPTPTGEPTPAPTGEPTPTPTGEPTPTPTGEPTPPTAVQPTTSQLPLTPIGPAGLTRVAHSGTLAELAGKTVTPTVQWKNNGNWENISTLTEITIANASDIPDILMRVRYDFEIASAKFDLIKARNSCFTFELPAITSGTKMLSWNGFQSDIQFAPKINDAAVDMATVQFRTGAAPALVFDYKAFADEAALAEFVGEEGLGALTKIENCFIELDCKLDLSALTDGAYDNTIMIGNATIKVKIESNKPKDPVALTVKKEGKWAQESGKHTGKVDWTFTITPGDFGTKSGYQFTDTLENQTYVADSFKIGDVATTLDGTSTATYLQYTFQAALGTDPVLIHFQTQPTADWLNEGGKLKENGTLSNTGKLHDPATENPDALDKGTATGTADIQFGWLGKVGARTEGGHEITWTLTLNKEAFPLKNVVIHDFLPEGLSIKAEPGKSGIQWKTQGGTFADLVKAPTTGTEDGKTVTLIDLSEVTVHELIIVEYKTEIRSDASYETTSYTNRAYLTFELPYGKDGAGVEMNPTIDKTVTSYGFAPIEKSGKYNPATHTIHWTVTVNKDLLPLTGATVTDTLQAPERHAYTGDVTYNVADSNSVKTITPAEGASSFSIPFGALLKEDETKGKSVKIEFDTILLKEEEFAYNIDAANKVEPIKNAVKLVSNLGERTATAAVPITGNVLEKSYVEYNYGTQEATWKFVVNKDKKTMNNAVLVDDLPSYMTYVAGSLTVGGSASSLSVTTPESSNPNRVEIHLGNLSAETTVTIRTKVDVTALGWNNGVPKDKIQMTNKAWLNYDGHQSGESYDKVVTNSPEINSPLLVKTGKQTNQNQNEIQVEYTILINKLMLDLVHASGMADNNVNTIVDTLGQGLKVDLASLKLEQGTISKDGATLISTGKEEISLIQNGKPIYTYTLTETGDVLRVPLPHGTGDSTKAYLLTYTVDIIKEGIKDNDSFTNTVALNAKGFTLPPVPIKIQVNEASAGGEGTSRAFLRLEKKSNVGRARAGAEFGLFDKYGTQLDCMKTKDDGRIVFRVPYFKAEDDSWYLVKELTPLAGHKISAPWDVGVKVQPKSGGTFTNWTFDGATPTLIEGKYLEIINEAIPYTIAFQKKNDLGYALSGVAFTLHATDKDNSYADNVQTSDADGKVSFAGVPYGEYTLTETKYPAYHEQNKTVYTVTVSVDGVVSDIKDDTGKSTDGVLLNTAHKGSIKLLKVDDKDATKRLSGAVFALYDGDGTGKPLPYPGKDGKPKAMVTDAKGELTFDNLMLGRVYTLREVSAPDKYDRIADRTIKLWPEADSIVVNGKPEKGDIPAQKAGSDLYTLALTLRDPLTYVPTPGPGDTDLYPEATPKPSPSVSPKPSPSVSPTPSPSVSPTPTPSPTPTVPGEVPPVLPPENPPEGPTVNPPENPPEGPTVNPPVNPPVAPPAVQPLPDGGIQGDITPGDPLYYIDDNGVPRGKGETPDPLYWIDPNGVPLGYMDPDGDWVFIDPNEIPLGFVEPDGTWVSFTPQTGDASDGWMVAFALLLVALSGMTALAARQGYRVYSKKRGQKSDRDNP